MTSCKLSAVIGSNGTTSQQQVVR